VWERQMAERGAAALSGAELDRSWPSRPECLARGAACVSIDVQEHAVGLVVIADKRSGQEFSTEDLEFLSTSAGVAAMAFANARSWAAQQDLIRSVEEQAAAVRRESEEKQQALTELDQKLAVIERQRSEIRQLSTPVLRLWDNVLAMPIVGAVDSRRGADIMERLLKEIPEQKCRHVILDITGVDVVDTWTARHLMKAIHAAELLGAQCIVTGIRPAVAQSLVQLGVDLSAIVTAGDLQEGLRECLRRIAEKKAAKRRAASAR